MIPHSIIRDQIADIDVDNMVANITTLSAFQTRYSPWTNAQDVADAVSTMFTDAGLEPTQAKWLDYDFTGDILTYGTADIIHVIAEVRGVVNPDKIVVVSAHHDCYVWGSDDPSLYGQQAPGADDNATGVCAMIEMARLIAANNYKPDYTIRFVSFGGEEIGLIGSGLYVDADEDVILNINLDMIGYSDVATNWQMLLHPYDTDDNAGDGGNSFHDLAELLIPEVTDITVIRGTLNFYVSDSYSYWLAGFPAIYFEEDPRTPYYHEITDTVANLNQPYYAEVTKAAFACLISFSNLQMRIMPMPISTTFNDALSTLDTISAWEKEVNRQAGYTSKWGLYSTSALTPFTITTLNTVAYAIVTLATGNTQTITGTGGSSLAGVIPIPTSDIVSVACYSATNVLLDTFGLNEGNGLTVYGTGGVLTGALSSALAWKLCQANITWQAKIDLAKFVLGCALESILTERGITVDEAGGDSLLDVITNPETFRIACDYKTLEMIYDDLSNGGFNQLFEGKAKMYRAKYDRELADAMKRMNMDTGLSGTTTEYRVEFTARVSR